MWFCSGNGSSSIILKLRLLKPATLFLSFWLKKVEIRLKKTFFFVFNLNIYICLFWCKWDLQVGCWWNQIHGPGPDYCFLYWDLALDLMYRAHGTWTWFWWTQWGLRPYAWVVWSIYHCILYVTLLFFSLIGSISILSCLFFICFFLVPYQHVIGCMSWVPLSTFLP